METKKAKITRTVFKNEWNGGNGTVYYHETELDNGDKGQIGCKDKEPAWLNPGQELNYTIETTDKGIKIKRVQEGKGGWSGGGRPQEDPKIKLIGFAMSYTKDLIIADKLKINQLEESFEKIFNKMISKI